MQTTNQSNNKSKGFETAKVHTLSELVSTVADTVVSRILHKNKAGNITQFAFGKGQGLSTHAAPFDAFVLVTDGEGQVTIDEKEYVLKAGQCILMPANIPHSVHATDDFQMLLVMLKEH